MNNIHILSGKVRSGKSTRLLDWYKKTSSCGGIITPLINGKKYIMNIESGEQRLLQGTGKENKNVIKTGNYYLLRETLEWAKNALFEANKTCPQWIVIDEIGYLELNNDGLEPAISRLLPEIEGNILLVIRERLVEKAVNHFQLYKYGKINISEQAPDAQ